MIIGFHYICYYVGCKLNEKVPNDLTNNLLAELI